MQVYFNGYTDEKITKGRNSYNKMVISYSYQGQSKTQQIMSFANPAVYAAVQGFKEGDLLDVEITKNDAGYNTWASVKLATATGGTPPNATSTVPARQSTYETPEERAKKQVYIIKQSCLAQAVATCAGQPKDALDNFTSDEVLAVAQVYVDWILDDGETEGQTS